MRVEPARTEDREPIARLLRDSDLPDDVDAFFPEGYVVARAGDAIVGCAGLETYGDAGLLRSVAVAPAWRRSKTGRQLVEDRLAAARRARLRAVYLLTTGAADYFRALGFRDCARADAPPAVRASTQFAGGCCASAACLVRETT